MVLQIFFMKQRKSLMRTCGLVGFRTGYSTAENNFLKAVIIFRCIRNVVKFLLLKSCEYVNRSKEKLCRSL